ncbi:MAG: 2-amino-4-hydroxy-6-hydroxymethyldihydropteridine diphosphokinase [Syntrophaceae bacterium]|nr:2-amino-4-hydroxy-6-hydroxymethyldihydropteridine diphosphokinase [Syntrophaceae bacterium]
MDGFICYIGIGSNLGNSLENCKKAVEILSRMKGIELKTVSSFYRTEPVGMDSQNYFTNAVAEIKTDLSPENLLRAMQDIEKEMGRERGVKNSPRVIDLDILFYGQNVFKQKELVIPHPEIHKRRFVLEPLYEIASYFVHPSFGISVRGLKDRLNDDKAVERIKEQ